jgi:hypothetical protein
VNTVLSTHVDKQKYEHPPSRTELAKTGQVTLADRVALHLGLALITWSRRPRTVGPQPSRDELRLRGELSLERAEREWQTERALRLGLPTR